MWYADYKYRSAIYRSAANFSFCRYGQTCDETQVTDTDNQRLGGRDPYAFTFLLRTTSGNNCRYAYSADVDNPRMQICNIHTPVHTPRMRFCTPPIPATASVVYLQWRIQAKSMLSTPNSLRLRPLGWTQLAPEATLSMFGSQRLRRLKTCLPTAAVVAPSLVLWKPISTIQGMSNN